MMNASCDCFELGHQPHLLSRLLTPILLTHLHNTHTTSISRLLTPILVTHLHNTHTTSTPQHFLPDPLTLFFHTKISHFTNIFKREPITIRSLKSATDPSTISLWRRCNTPKRWRLFLSSFRHPFVSEIKKISWNMRVRCKKSLVKLNPDGCDVDFQPLNHGCFKFTSWVQPPCDIVQKLLSMEMSQAWICFMKFWVSHLLSHFFLTFLVDGCHFFHFFLAFNASALKGTESIAMERRAKVLDAIAWNCGVLSCSKTKTLWEENHILTLKKNVVKKVAWYG